MNDLFIETIRYAGGRLHLLDLHDSRMRDTQREVFGQVSCCLTEQLFHVPAHLADCEVVKCRVVYGREIEKIEYEAYTPRPLDRLRLVTDDAVDYHLKYLERSCLAYPDVEHCDGEGLVIVKNGLVTDSTYANLLFYAGEKVYTPSTPLLPGVMRRHLLATGCVEAVALRPADILPGNALGITHATIINAMLPPGAIAKIPVTRF